MPIRKILVPLMGLPADRPALDLAFAAGRQVDAHITALYAAYDALRAVAFLDDRPTGAPETPGAVGVLEAETGAKLREARANYDAAKAKWAAPPRSRPAQGLGFSAGFEISNIRMDDAVAEQGRVTDLIVLGLPAPIEGAMLATVVHAAIMETCRPVLLAPQKTHDAPFRRVAIAWNGSASATQAIGHALPFLARAEEVTVLAVENPVFAGPPASQAVDYIGWHDIAARVVKVEIGSGKPAGIALLEAASAAGADMLVMGAYSQSRVRRMIAGGVTRAVMERTGLPILLAH